MGNPLIINRIVTKNNVGHQNRCGLDESLLSKTNQMQRLVVGESEKEKRDLRKPGDSHQTTLTFSTMAQHLLPDPTHTSTVLRLVIVPRPIVTIHSGP
jgi:hypothetical protein